MKRTFMISSLMLILLVLMLTVSSSAQEDVFPARQFSRDGTSVTIYNQGSALIRERRTFDLRAGLNLINFSDVAAYIDPTSVNLVSLTDPTGTEILEQNYVYDLISTGALIERYLDEQVRVTLKNGTIYTGQLISAQIEVILRDENDQVIAINSAEIISLTFPDMLDALVTRPTLRWLLRSEVDGPQQLELTYLTSGMSWSADYSVLLNPDQTALDLTGWVTLNNTSGISYENVLLKLVAGDINRIQFPEPPVMRDVMPAPMPTPTDGAKGVEQREFFEYHLYEVARPVTIGNNESKQIEFVSESQIPAQTFYVYDTSNPFYGYYSPLLAPEYGLSATSTVATYLGFRTDEESSSGVDLPAGRMRVYQNDVDGAALLIGENRIDHTPEGEEIEIYLGNAFDLVGERTRPDFQMLSATVLRETFEIRLRNRKDDQTVEIRVPERLTRWSEWEILESSAPYERIDAATIEFRVQVAPQEEALIRYTVQYQVPG